MSARDYYLSDDPEAILAAMGELQADSGGPVTKPEGANPRTQKPEQGGILCARIFGPVEDERCLCGKLRGDDHLGQTCDECGVLCGDSELRQRRFGHVEAPAPLLHPALRPLIAERVGCAEQDLRKVAHRAANLHADGSVVRAQRNEYGMMVFEDPAEEEHGARGLEYLHQRLGKDGDRLMPRWLPVTPPGWRDGSRDPQNDAFRRVINRAERLRRLLELDAPKIINDNEERLLQQAFEQLYETVRAELSARESGAPRADDDRTGALLVEVYATPDDDGPRAVYADRLSELGDPRGEFITLQLARPEAKRLSRAETELLRRHFDHWIGELGPVVDREVFRRGFLQSCRAQRVEAAGLLESEAWATVELLDSDEPALITAPQLRALRELRTNARTWLALSRRGATLPRIERAMIRLTRCPPAHAEALVDRALLPNLRQLVLLHQSAKGDHDWSWLLDSELAKGLQALTLAGTLERLVELRIAAWAEVLARHPGLSTLTLSLRKKSLVFELRADKDAGFALTLRPATRFLELVAIQADIDYAGQLARALEGVEDRLTVETKHAWFNDLEALGQRLRDAGARWVGPS
jgi:uncharacterized protein (TIGR02996 family)